MKSQGKKCKFDPELQKNCPEYRSHEQVIPSSFCHAITAFHKKMSRHFLGQVVCVIYIYDSALKA